MELYVLMVTGCIECQNKIIEVYDDEGKALVAKRKYEDLNDLCEDSSPEVFTVELNASKSKGL